MNYKHINKANKDLALGQGFYPRNIYVRNGVKPQGYRYKEVERYRKQEFSDRCVYVGKRVINYKGYTHIDCEGCEFCPAEKWTVHLVAISKQRLAYVIDEDVD